MFYLVKIVLSRIRAFFTIFYTLNSSLNIQTQILMVHLVHLKLKGVPKRRIVDFFCGNADFFQNLRIPQSALSGQPFKFK